MAIAGFVVPVIVLAVNAVPGSGFLAHVLKEGQEAVPAVADRNASAAVNLKFLVPYVEATVAHMKPRFVFGRPPHSVPLKFFAELSHVHIV